MDQNQPPLTPSNPAIPAFDPVPVKFREDGWTPDKQLGFIEALAECGCVGDAARRVGMTPQSAYALRVREGSTAFLTAWRVALETGAHALGDAAWSRALHGTVTPIFYRGEQVGERRVFNERLTMFLLSRLDPVRFGKWDRRYRRAGASQPSRRACKSAHRARRRALRRRRRRRGARSGGRG